MKTSSRTLFLLALFLVFPIASNAADITVDAASLISHVEIFPAQKSGTFIEGAVFEIPILINTRNQNINTLELNIKFDPERLSIVEPSGGKSIIGLWIEPPTYNNLKGTEKLGGIITNGITTDAGLIVTLTFKAKKSGDAVVSIGDDSQALLNNGLGTPAQVDTVRGVYTILPRPPGGVKIFSPTHPVQDRWYNNNSPIFTWDRDPDVTGFSVVLDNKPNTVPSNTTTTNDTTYSYQDVPNGISYFHIKALKKGAWGETTHFQVLVDTEPPADFIPTTSFLASTSTKQALVSFFSTDSLSGIDHYEIGVIDASKSGRESPVFIQTGSPYQIPLDSDQAFRVIVRAFDRAGNARDVSIDVKAPFFFMLFLSSHATSLLLALATILLLLILIHYLFGHHIIRHMKRAYEILKNSNLDQ